MNAATLVIREFQSVDMDAVVACMATLQDHERQFETARLDSNLFAKHYIDNFLPVLKKDKGQIFVAVLNEEYAGFTSVLLDELLDPDFNHPIPLAHISDLIVLPQYRRNGIAKALLAKAEQFAYSRGAQAVRLYTMAKDPVSCNLYRAQGFDDYEIIFLKRLVNKKEMAKTIVVEISEF